MRMWFALPLLLAVSPAAAQPGDGQRDGVAAWRALREGRILSIREIEKRVVPTMKDAQYIGFDFEMPSAVYTLKFLRDGTVIWVDVDGRSGQVIGRTGK
ncbi:hypothetical protein F1C10_09490 [Sphingomonas sp. NBWT7]|uniref:hypothetical protein n=1 Tax=unclassified Sphingomonas TaxID=196159 RepID=UPI000A26741E|nr:MULTISPECIES: hypothetical protein [unclassified Sphingomonas]QNE32152.1 hypothetical protein F1C10_09490 [Sphingomonas sp. NBWT7]